ncbi:MULTISPECIES: NADP-dependent oxidoreductase [unclassified Novosphingobium]|uniref:NADP-dependent oxidoreductase n=1 Tax=unclassified Novosphingobium TaxID=2644732 RepID=UPI00020EEB5C|nr:MULTISPECIES: NADP-dependent oxidoreductase [unclassified Novosphingobium]GFM30632.1 oxidoreductase, zinc-binding [Novosphingobium sp. PY1]CCA92197.1 oxidoreductase, zinc-binding [Novosphingobium sp. PP1Y]
MALTNRRWLLARRPQGELSLDDFAFEERPFEEPELAAGEVIVRTGLFACTPTVRNMLNDAGHSHRGSIPLGNPIQGITGGLILRSRHPRYPEGKRLVAVLGWEDYRVIAPDLSPLPVFLLPDDMTIEEALGVAGLNAQTGYCGMLHVGRPRPGETVVVSAASGSTGSIAAQVARIGGCRVIGIAGGKAKCDWLLNEARLDAAIDYKNEDVANRLAELCPEGIDVFYDNVGGSILQAAMDNIAVHGRVVVCGQLSAYDSGAPAPGPDDMMKVVYSRVRIEGFVIGDFDAATTRRAQADLLRWHREGALAHRLDIRHGFEALAASYLDLFRGGNEGTLVVRTADID